VRNITKAWKSCIVALGVSMSGVSLAAPFNNCPSDAFLVQDTVARLYGVNLATGFYEELSSDMGTSGKLNAIGYNFHDDYLYAYSYEFQTVVRIGNDYQVEPLTISNMPNTSFYVGDLSLADNYYYFYRRGGGFGLYRVGLDAESADYLVAEKAIDDAMLDLRIYDMAFHPNNGSIYSVDGGGQLIKIDLASGSFQDLGNVGESGTFGAVYFDVDGNFYISRNSDGFVFRIAVDAVEPAAEFFAFGPSTGNNDGARCALAPIISEDSAVDFGDAPSSYGISLNDNGARHQIIDGLLLGEIMSGEDDGVDFVTGFESGLDTLIRLHAQGEGYISAWADWDQSGTFEDSEQIIFDQAMSNNSKLVLVDVPAEATAGDTWTRFRYTTTTGVGPNGGVSDGEVEDYAISVTASGVSITHYPSENGFVTLAYEDNWPELGDYDMNDVVVSYRTKTYTNDEQRVVRYDIEGEVLAVGASYHNGFAVQLDGVETGNVATELMRYELNGEAVDGTALEANDATDSAVIIVVEDTWAHLQADAQCSFFRTEMGCNSTSTLTFRVSVPLIASVPAVDAPSGILNPFIFATPGYYHGDAFASPPGRGLEIHLKNQQVTARFDTTLFGLSDDASVPEEDNRFVSINNMPWAMELPILWNHPRERIDLSKAYPEFPTFVTSDGAENRTWYTPERMSANHIIEN